MPPEVKNNFLAIYDEEGNLVWTTDSSVFEGIEYTANKELEKEAIEEQKALKKAKRKEKLEKINKVVKLIETLVLLCSLYYKYKLKKKGN